MSRLAVYKRGLLVPSYHTTFGVLRVGSLVKRSSKRFVIGLPEDIATPGKGKEHERTAEAVGQTGQGQVIAEEPGLGKEKLPVMEPIGRGVAGVAPQQGEDSGPGISDIGGNIEKVFAQPPQPHCGCKGIPGLEEKDDHADQGHEELAQGPAQRGEERAQGTEEDMARLMKGGIDQMEQALSGRIGGDGCKNELPAPDKQDSQDKEPANKAGKAHVQGHIEKEVF